MKFLHLLFILAVAGACVYFYLDDKKTPRANTSLRPLPPAPVDDPSPDSLAGKLKTVEDKRPELKKNKMIFSDLRSYYFGSAVEKKGITDLNEAKKLLSQMEKVFEVYRELNKCTTLGFQWCGDPRQQLTYPQSLRIAMYELLFSAEYHFLRGNQKQGLQDIETALHIINILCKDASGAIDLLLSLGLSQNLAAAVKRIKLPAKEKQQLLKKLPGREQYAAVLPSVLEKEKKMLLFWRAWAPELEHEAIEDAIKAKLPRNTPPEAAAEVRKQIGEEVKQKIGKEYEKGKKLKEIPVEKLEKIYADFTAFALKGFKENTLTKETRYTTGSAEDDKFFALMDQIGTQVFVCSFSARLDAFEKKHREL